MTLKDLNFTDFDLVALQEHQRDAILKQLRQDTALLQAHSIMDYSLLVGIHNLDQAAKEQAVSLSQSFCPFLIVLCLHT